MSKIQWTDETWNPITGCTPISEGCANCYARRMATRLAGRFGYPEIDPFAVTWHSDRLEQPLQWCIHRLIFTCSMGDLFHERVDNSLIWQVYNTMRRAKQHTFQVLTKRADRALAWYDWIETTQRPHWPDSIPWPLPNVWLGVTAENGQRLKERWPIIQQIPAAVKFISAEPMLDDVFAAFEQGWTLPDWIIAGGESGPGARPMNPDWARAAREFALCWGIPFFFKQWGEWKAADTPQEMIDLAQTAKYVSCQTADSPLILWRVGAKQAGHLLDGQTWCQFPTT